MSRSRGVSGATENSRSSSVTRFVSANARRFHVVYLRSGGVAAGHGAVTPTDTRLSPPAAGPTGHALPSSRFLPVAAAAAVVAAPAAAAGRCRFCGSALLTPIYNHLLIIAAPHLLRGLLRTRRARSGGTRRHFTLRAGALAGVVGTGRSVHRSAEAAAIAVERRRQRTAGGRVGGRAVPSRTMRMRRR